MGFSYSAPHMIFIITFVLVSLHFSHILPVDGRRERETSIEKVSGRDDNEEKEPLIFEKFRALLGLESFRRSSNGDLEDGSPSPAPSPAIEAPAPAPVRLTHGHSHHRPIAKLPRIHKEINGDQDNNRGRKILAATLASAGVTFLLCGIGFIWACQNFRKRKKRSSACTDEGRSKYVNSQNSVKKVTSDPGPDIFYLDSIGTALEPHPFCLKQNSEIVSTYSCQNTSICTLLKQEEGEESKQEKIESEHDNDCEIVSVHENGESAHYEPDGGSSSSGDEIVFTEAHSSDDESFHSFCDSHSSNARLSNASACSLGENSESFSSQVPSSMEKNTPTGPCSSSNQNNFVPPLPPPPPPPPPPLPRHHISVSPSQSLSLSTQIAPRGQSSSTLPNLSPPRNSKFSSVSNRTPESDLRPTGDIPPPPCPPPFPKGISNNTKTPPPPPSQFPQYASLGKDVSPLPKLKPLHWDKVRAAPDRTMVWDKLRSSSFELDEKMIESLFGYNLQNSMKNDETKNKSPSPSKHVLDPKRLQNITILSKALNVTPEHVCDALMQGSGLCLQQLEALIKMEPTKDEAAKLSSYKGDIGELGSAEKFVKTMLNIPFAFSRIEAMLYRETFEDEVVHLRKSFLMLQEACKELKSSRLFLKLLEAVLKTGNRMNVGTIRGGARAFKLDTLLKLSDVKGTDGRTTLLHFVVQEIVRSEGIRVSESIIGKINLKNKRKNAEDKEEDYRRMGLELVSGLSTELLNVKKTATIDLDVIASSVSNLSDGMAKLKNLVHNDLCMDTKNRDFVQSMRSFLNEAEKNLKELQEDEDRVLLHVREITEYFHGSMSKDESNPLRIFVIVRDFLGMLDHVCKELRSLKIPRSPNPLAPFR